MKPESVCAVMLRAPRLGRVKTRLAESIGAEKALSIYRVLVETQIAAIPQHWRVGVHFTPADADDEMRTWLGEITDFHQQVDGDLGKRLDAAVRIALRGRGERCFLMGGDCPGLDRSFLENAETALADADVVIAPAVDGGYALLGLKEACSSLFHGITWGTPAVLAQTMERVSVEGLRVVSLPAVEDVDDKASWERNKHLVRGVIP